MKKTFVTLGCICLLIVLAFSFTGCFDKSDKIVTSLQNDSGLIIDGGGFKEGSSLVCKEIKADTEDAKKILSVIDDEEYNKEANVYILDIHVTKDGEKVQPNGKVKVTFPVPNIEIDSYLVFHIKSDNSVEKLTPTVADGKITFEVSSFSHFIFIEDIPKAPCSHVYGEYERVDIVSCLETGRIARQCTRCGYVDITTAPGSHKYGELTPGKEATYYEEGVLSYYSCLTCRGLFNEAKEPITSTVIPKVTPEFAVYLDGTFAGKFELTNTSSGDIMLSLKNISVTEGQTVTICNNDGTQTYGYTVAENYYDGIGFKPGNIDLESKTIRTTSTSSFTLVLERNSRMKLYASDYVHSGVVMEISNVYTGKKPMYFPMSKVDLQGDPETQAYVYGIIGTDKYYSFRIIDLESGKVYGYDDIIESQSYDTWSYERGENGEIKFSSNLTDWWIAFDINGDKKITLNRFNYSNALNHFTLVFESGDAPMLEKIDLTPGSNEYKRYTWPLTNDVFQRQDQWKTDLTNISIYRAAVHVEDSVKFCIGMEGITRTFGCENLSLVILKEGTLVKNGNYIEITKPGDYIIEYLPFCNVINVIDPTLFPEIEPHEHTFVDGKCACGATDPDYVPPHEHSYEEVVTPPTCTADGCTTYTCACGDSYTGNTVTALGHSYATVVTPPTCTAEGYTTYTCACGDSYTGNTVAALGHSYATVVTSPTCTADGYTTYTCACGDSYIGNTVAALGHSYATVVTSPTCTAEGYTTYTCACGDSYIGNTVAALGHSYTDGSCSICGEADPDYTPDSDSKIIDRIDVLGVTMPYTGKKPVTDDEPYVIQKGIEILSVEWVKEDDYNYGNYIPFGPSDYFEYGYSKYTVKVRLQLKSGYKFSYNSEYDYYDMRASVNYVQSWDVRVNGNIVEFYTQLGCNDTTIYYVGIVGVNEVVPGAHPNYNLTTVYDGFHISEIRWINESEGDGTPGSGRIMTEDDIFVEDCFYYLEIIIEVDEGYIFFVDVYGVWVSAFIDDMETGAQTIDGVNGNEGLVVSFGYYCMAP